MPQNLTTEEEIFLSYLEDYASRSQLTDIKDRYLGDAAQYGSARNTLSTEAYTNEVKALQGMLLLMHRGQGDGDAFWTGSVQQLSDQIGVRIDTASLH